VKHIHSHTITLCPACLQKTTSRIIEDDDKVFIERFCREHGYSRSLICGNSEWYRDSIKYVKPRQFPISNYLSSYQGCPDSCGLCPEHQQHTCLPVIEITSLCDLECPVCLKKFNKQFTLSLKDFKKAINCLLGYENKVDVINISGGEPTLHPQFEEMLKWACNNFLQVTVSTNGLRLLRDRNLRKLFKETDSIAAVQFDGFNPKTYRFLRGRDLSAPKKELLRRLENEGVRYSLVSTIVKGVNDGEIHRITDFFFRSNALSLMFQPAAFTGRAQVLYRDDRRMTIPDIVREIEKSNNVKMGDFNPLPCSHYSCFALSYYIKTQEHSFMSLKEFLGVEKYLDAIANKTLPGLDTEGYGLMKERIYALWSASDAGGLNEATLKRIKNVLQKMNAPGFTRKKAYELGLSFMKAIFIHDFMDVHTFDFARLIKCCNPYLCSDGKLIPMCAQNVFF